MENLDTICWWLSLYGQTLTSYLSELSAGRGWGSVKTCSVNGPGGPDRISVWLAVDSVTSVASVASSADCAAWIFPFMGGAVGAKAQHHWNQRQTCNLDTFLTFLQQHRNEGAFTTCPPCPLSIMGVSVREEQLLRATLQLVAQPTRVIPASMPSMPPVSSPPPALPSPGSNTISPAG